MRTLFNACEKIKPHNRLFALGVFEARDNTAPVQPYTDGDWTWYCENVADRSAGYTAEDDTPTDPGFTDCLPLDPDADRYAILGRLLSGKPVSVSELNAMRTAFGHGALDAACSCEAFDEPGECPCGTKLYRVGLKRYTAEAREALATSDRWADHLAEAADVESFARPDLECWRS